MHRLPVVVEPHPSVRRFLAKDHEPFYTVRAVKRITSQGRRHSRLVLVSLHTIYVCKSDGMVRRAFDIVDISAVLTGGNNVLLRMRADKGQPAFLFAEYESDAIDARNLNMPRVLPVVLTLWRHHTGQVLRVLPWSTFSEHLAELVKPADYVSPTKKLIDSGRMRYVRSPTPSDSGVSDCNEDELRRALQERQQADRFKSREEEFEDRLEQLMERVMWQHTAIMQQGADLHQLSQRQVECERQRVEDNTFLSETMHHLADELSQQRQIVVELRDKASEVRSEAKCIDAPMTPHSKETVPHRHKAVATPSAAGSHMPSDSPSPSPRTPSRFVVVPADAVKGPDCMDSMKELSPRFLVFPSPPKMPDTPASVSALKHRTAELEARNHELEDRLRELLLKDKEENTGRRNKGDKDTARSARRRERREKRAKMEMQLELATKEVEVMLEKVDEFERRNAVLAKLLAQLSGDGDCELTGMPLGFGKGFGCVDEGKRTGACYGGAPCPRPKHDEEESQHTTPLEKGAAAPQSARSSVRFVDDEAVGNTSMQSLAQCSSFSMAVSAPSPQSSWRDMRQLGARAIAHGYAPSPSP